MISETRDGAQGQMPGAPAHAPTRAEIRIAGMTCAMCAKAIEKAVCGLPGVLKAEVNLGKESATVEWDKDKVGLRAIEKAVTDAGYQVIDERRGVKIGGMTCVMCAGAIEKAVAAVEGVTAVAVNLGAEKAQVTYNPRTGLPFRHAPGDRGGGLPVPRASRARTRKTWRREARARDLREKLHRIIVGFSVGHPPDGPHVPAHGHARRHALRDARRVRRPSSST